MATDDVSISTPSMTKRPPSRKHRILTQNQTTGSNGTSKLPSLLSKSSVFLSTSETTHFTRSRRQHKDIVNTSSSSSKTERQTTNHISQTRLPPLNTTSNDPSHKQRSEFQRRQIYALNHLMRELEQEQFQQFCKLNGIGVENSEEIISNDEDLNKQLPTST